jgi:hypothetical protein
MTKPERYESMVCIRTEVDNGWQCHGSNTTSMVQGLAARVATRGIVVVGIVTGLAARPRYAEGSEAYVADASGVRLAVARLSLTWPCLTRLSLTDISERVPPSPRRIRKAVWSVRIILARRSREGILARAVLTSMRDVQ